MKSSDIARLIDLLEAAYSGSPWHGPSLQDNLKRVTAADAARRRGSAHTIWELVLHLAAWRGEIAKRLLGSEAGTPPEGDYPPPPEGEDATGEQWQKALAWLDDSQQRVLSAARTLNDEDLQKPVLDHRTHASGEGATRYATLVGLMQHDAYHSGQIAVLMRM